MVSVAGFLVFCANCLITVGTYDLVAPSVAVPKNKCFGLQHRGLSQ